MQSSYVYSNTNVETARVVETTVEEYFDEDGRLTSRTTKTVTRYEKAPQYQIWNEQSPHTQILPCTTSQPIITN